MEINEDIFHYFNWQRPENLNQFSNVEGFLGEQLFQEPSLLALTNAKIAIIGIDETRNAYPMPYLAKADNVRYWLYQLSAFNNLPIVDLGNLILGNTISDTYKAVEYITESLVSCGVIPIYICGSHDITQAIVNGLLLVQRKIEIGIIDSQFDVINSESINSRSFINQILKTDKHRTLINIIGYQSYFTSANQHKTLNDNNIDTYRLGLVRQNIDNMEPVLRDCDMVSLDVNAIRQTEMQAAHQPSPNGFYAEEACQLATFAGLSDKSKLFSIFELVSKNTPIEMSAHLAAQVIWHYIFGISQRKNDYPMCNLDDYKKIFVKINNLENDIIFYQNPKNDRFWMEISQKNNENIAIVSCSKTDYVQLINNNISDRINRILRRYCP